MRLYHLIMTAKSAASKPVDPNSFELVEKAKWNSAAIDWLDKLQNDPQKVRSDFLKDQEVLAKNSDGQNFTFRSQWAYQTVLNLAAEQGFDVSGYSNFVAENPERTPKMYAIEHAGYMVTSAKRLLESYSNFKTLEYACENGDSVESLGNLANELEIEGEEITLEDVGEAEQSFHEAIHTMESGIYEFEKRANRCEKSSDFSLRTDEDYAIEFAEHLVRNCETFLTSYNDLSLIVMEREEIEDSDFEDIDSNIESMTQSMGEFVHSIKSGIYEFEHRSWDTTIIKEPKTSSMEL